MIVFKDSTEEYVRQQVLESQKVFKPTKRDQLVEGVGINDANYHVSTKYKDLDGKSKYWSCPLYAVWRGMIMRCYRARYLAKYPAYVGCSVHKDWHSFMKFREWMITQDWQGNELDKDLLVFGNKEYSKDTCVFLPPNINSFLIDQVASRGACSIGVVKSNQLHRRSPYRAGINNQFTKKMEYLGYFKTDAEAHAAWKKRKHELAVELSKTVTDPRIINALITRYI